MCQTPALTPDGTAPDRPPEGWEVCVHPNQYLSENLEHSIQTATCPDCGATQTTVIWPYGVSPLLWPTLTRATDNSESKESSE